jgi:hypothetical protein
MFEHRAKGAQKSEFWLRRDEIAAPGRARFYRELETTLQAQDFTKEAPVIYFSMLTILRQHGLSRERLLGRGTVPFGDECDTDGLSARGAEAHRHLGARARQGKLAQPGRELAGEKEYLASRTVAPLKELEVQAVIADPLSGQHRRDRPTEERAVLRSVLRAIRNARGKAFSRWRGGFPERSFCQVFDYGGRRRATLRGRANFTKRHLRARLTHNFLLLVRRVRTTSVLPAKDERTPTTVIGCTKCWLQR